MHLTRRFTLHFILFLCLIVPIHGWTQTKLTLRPHLVSRASEHRNHIYPFVEERRPRVGLVLSGGGARGAAQIGVLKVLERHKIPIDFIAATSMGAIVGGLYASGYTTAEIESLALTTNWDELLSFSDEAKRTDLAIDQKLAADWSFLVVRFEGLQPVIPHAVSSGQRLTNFLSEQTLQALYHPDPTFDDLKIPFRAVTTDLVSGKRIVLDRGSLAQALRASATVLLLFNPIEQDSMRLVDGGLVSNIPVDVARDAGCDIVLAVNSTSGLRTADEMTAPWQTADQIMGIMMQLSNQEQLKLADITITPEIGGASLVGLHRTGHADRAWRRFDGEAGRFDHDVVPACAGTSGRRRHKHYRANVQRRARRVRWRRPRRYDPASDQERSLCRTPHDAANPQTHAVAYCRRQSEGRVGGCFSG